LKQSVGSREAFCNCGRDVSHRSDVEKRVAAFTDLIKIVLTLSILESLDALIDSLIEASCLRTRHFNLFHNFSLLDCQVPNADISHILNNKLASLNSEIARWLSQWLSLDN